jgi:hypothetical protein
MKMIMNEDMDMNVDLDMEMDADIDMDMETVTGMNMDIGIQCHPVKPTLKSASGANFLIESPYNR